MNQPASLLADSQPDETAPVRFGCVGLGGYAGASCEFLERCSADPSLAGPVRLSAVFEPDQRRHAGRIEQLRQRGVRVLERYEDLLHEPIEALWLPLPIDLHRPFTIQALEAGKGVLCEKPAAGAVEDVDAMIAARDRHQKPVLIGYQHLYDPITRQLKRLLLEGAIGPIRSACVWACWPRSTEYFSRNNWAGRHQRNGVWVMDSPANNALAHYLNLPLFLLGETEADAAVLERVEAELYRANPIENYDTASLRIITRRQIPLLVLFTHACGQTHEPLIRIEGEDGFLSLEPSGQTTLTSRRSSQRWPAYGDPRGPMIDAMRRQVRGLAPISVLATLETSRAQTVVVNAASEAACVHEIPSGYVRHVALGDQRIRAVRGIESAFEKVAAMGMMLHESGLVEWSAPAQSRDVRDYHHFAGPRCAPSTS